MPICTFVCKESVADDIDIFELFKETKRVVAHVMEVGEGSVLISMPSQRMCSECDITLLIQANDTEPRRENIDDRALAIKLALEALITISVPLYVDITLVRFGIASDGSRDAAKRLL